MARCLKVLTLTLSVCVLTFDATPAVAQSPTGSIAGKISDPNGGAVAAATVTVESPNLQGVMTTATSAYGDYIFKLLPPGRYTVTVKAQGFAESKQAVTVSATQPVALDLMVKPAAVTEVVDVQASAPAFANTVQGSTNLKSSLVGMLPTARTLLSAVDLTPAVHATGPGGARTIAGAMSFENAFMVNGVQTQDNIRGVPFDLFIEDAIQEATTTSSGVSADYGRFLGGVVNVITKSGGNMMSGSFRTTFTNDSWRAVSPFGEPKADSVVPTHEITVGGAIVPNRTWFFGAARVTDSTVARQTGEPHVPYEFGLNQQRYEGKITQSLGRSQRLQASFIGIQETQRNAAYPSVDEVLDVRALTTRELPQRLMAFNYTGTIGRNFFLEGQFSSRRFAFDGDGGMNKDPIQGTPFIDNGTGEWWWAPSFCGVCGGEHRDNDDVFVKGSWFSSTSTGSHNVTFGYDMYNDKRRGDNRQSASDYHVYTSNHVVRDGVVYPVMVPYPDSFSSFVVFWPLSESSKGTNFRTHSLFVNDNWAANRHLSFNLGVRFDKNHGRDHGGNLIADDSILSPRLGMVYDPTGNGTTTINASFSRYVAGIAGSVAEGASPAGTPSILVYLYAGESINADPDGPLMANDVAMQRIFDWYNNSGDRDQFLIQATIPGVSVSVPKSLKSPHADEMAVGLSQQLGSRGSLRVDLVRRTFGDFYANRIDTTTGTASDEFGQEFDAQVIENTNVTRRSYNGLHAQASFRPATGIDVGVSYALSKTVGNINGENTGSGPVATNALLYPEYRDLKWYAPEGPLSADQRHRARAWMTWAGSMGPNGMSVGLIQHMQSGTPYGAIGTIPMFDEHGPFVANPGYLQEPDTQTYFFTARDAFHTESMLRTDVSFNLERRIGSTRPAQVFVQFHLLNVFNQFAAFDNSNGSINTTVLTANDDPERFLPFNPFTETPVKGTHWDVGERFGQPIGSGAYTLPRTFRMSAGIKF